MTLPAFLRSFAGHGCRLAHVEILDPDGDVLATTYGNQDFDVALAREIVRRWESFDAMRAFVESVAKVGVGFGPTGSQGRRFVRQAADLLATIARGDAS